MLLTKEPPLHMSSLNCHLNIKSYICISFTYCQFLLIGFINAQTTPLKFKHITGEQGLSNSTIETIYQDSRGFIWFGTRDGLNKYDGSQIKVFKNQLLDTLSLSDNYTRAICEDAQHNLWVGTLNGLNKYNPNKNNFTRYKHQPQNIQSLSNNDVTCIYTDKKMAVWVGTDGGGLNLYNSTTNGFKHFIYQKSNINTIPSNTINCVFEDSKQRFWIGTNKGLCLLNREKGRFFSNFNLAGNQNTSINYAILKIQEDKQGNIWLGTFNDGIVIINTTTQTIKKILHNDKDDFSLSTNQIRALLTDKKGNIWTGGINGSLDLYKPDKTNFEHSKNESGKPLGLSQKTISAIFEDNQNNLWIGTHRGGINFYAPLADKFQLLQQGTNSNTLSYNDVKAFYKEDNNNIWIGTDGGGLNLYNSTNNTFTHFKHNAYNANSINSDAVLSINKDHLKNLWVGTWGGGLDLMDSQLGSFRHFINNPNNQSSISSNYVQTTLEDSEGNFWVATYYGGLNLFNPKNYQFTRITSDFSQKTSIYGNNIVSLNEDKEKNLWIGTDDGGLNCYNLLTKRFTHYFVNGEKTPDIRVVFTDSKGRVWAGQNGLYLFNKQDNKFQLFTEKGGLSTTFIKGILEDEKGNLWISTSNGLTKLNPNTYEFKKYNIADGLQGLEFEAGAFMKTNNGEMYFGGINGFNKFYPKDITLNQFEAPIHITGFQIFNQEMLPNEPNSPLKNDISLTNTITLNYQQSTLSFSYALLDYTAPENNQYAYKLDGLDKTWQYSNTERKASYTNLTPGHYTFYVKAANNDGVWNSSIASVNIDILPPFWATWWFRTIIILVLFTTTYLLLRFKKNLDLHKLEESKRAEMHLVQLQFFTNISHEFRTPLALILGPLEKMMKEDKALNFKQYYKTIHRNANRLLLLINELMDFRKAESGALKLKVMPGNLNLFLLEIIEDFKNLATIKNIDFTIRVGLEFGETWFDRQILEKIILNLVDNAFKYTADGGKITVELYGANQNFISAHQNKIDINNDFKPRKTAFIRVSDNGIGIAKDSINHLFERYYRITDAHLGSGVGLAFVKSLTLIHKGSLAVFSEKDKGSDFLITIPIDKSDYILAEKWLPSAEDVGTQLESIIAPYHQSDYHNLDEGLAEAQAIQKPTNSYKILIVDDNNELRLFIKNSLLEFYDVVEAVNGLQGIDITKAEMPDMIISDLMMPVMNGIDFCKHIKNNTATSQIPFIILSAKDAIQSKLEGAGSGADLYFPKPANMDLLLLSIHNIFQQRKLLKERYIKNYFIEATEATDANKDTIFLDQFTKLIEQELSNADLDVDYICKEMGMSKTKLYHRIKGISGQSIGEFVRAFRLKKAAYIITHEDVLLTDVMYRVGIQTQSYFTKAFKKEFGKTPSQFLSDNKRGDA